MILIWNFFRAVRQMWRTATILGLIDAAAIGFIVINISIVGRMQADELMFVVSGAVTLFVGTIVLSVNVYMWALLALEDLPVRRVIEMSLRFALAYPLPTFGVLGASAALIAVSLLLPRGVFVFVTASAVAYVTAWGSWRVIRRHLTGELTPRINALGFAGQADRGRFSPDRAGRRTPSSIGYILPKGTRKTQGSTCPLYYKDEMLDHFYCVKFSGVGIFRR